jgi:hypothetical protein
MKIQLRRMTVREVVKDFQDSAEEGVVAFGGLLDVRPKYQREFVYRDQQRDAVIHTIRQGFPLNVMYWMLRDDGGYELLDGQQRTISIGQYVIGDYSIDNRFFHNLTMYEQNLIMDYELMIYICEGTDKERLDWFRVINIAGEKLSDQEIRNAVYTGPWLTDAKGKFSKTNCAAYLLANDGGQLLTGKPIRQEYLEEALSWISNKKIEDYMAKHQHDDDAEDLWEYFCQVIAWVRATFPVYRREMSLVEWGLLYNNYGRASLSPSLLEERVKSLMQDEDVTRKSGIYDHVLSGDERVLSIRSFTPAMRREAYERQSGRCPKCGEEFSLEQMEADHILLWSEGGKTTSENCQMLCIADHREKSRKR